MISYAIIPIIVPLMAHNTFVLLQLLEYDRQESGMNIYNALKNKGSKCARWSFSPNIPHIFSWLAT